MALVLSIGQRDQHTSIQGSCAGEDLKAAHLLLVQVVPILGGVHALDLVLLVCGDVAPVLDKAGHSLIANRVELSLHEVIDVSEGLTQLLGIPGYVLL